MRSASSALTVNLDEVLMLEEFSENGGRLHNQDGARYYVIPGNPGDFGLDVQDFNSRKIVAKVKDGRVQYGVAVEYEDHQPYTFASARLNEEKVQIEIKRNALYKRALQNSGGLATYTSAAGTMYGVANPQNPQEFYWISQNSIMRGTSASPYSVLTGDPYIQDDRTKISALTNLEGAMSRPQMRAAAPAAARAPVPNPGTPLYTPPSAYRPVTPPASWQPRSVPVAPGTTSPNLMRDAINYFTCQAGREDMHVIDRERGIFITNRLAENNPPKFLALVMLNSSYKVALYTPSATGQWTPSPITNPQPYFNELARVYKEEILPRTTSAGRPVMAAEQRRDVPAQMPAYFNTRTGDVPREMPLDRATATPRQPAVAPVYGHARQIDEFTQPAPHPAAPSVPAAPARSQSNLVPIRNLSVSDLDEIKSKHTSSEVNGKRFFKIPCKLEGNQAYLCFSNDGKITLGFSQEGGFKAYNTEGPPPRDRSTVVREAQNAFDTAKLELQTLQLGTRVTQAQQGNSRF